MGTARSAVKWWFTAIVLCPVVRAQEVPEFTSQVDRVLLDVSVTTGRGEPVQGLGKENFVLRESGREQAIQEFGQGSSDIAVGIVVDYSASMRSRRSSVIEGVETLISVLQPADQALLLSFNDQPHLLQDMETVQDLRLPTWRSALLQEPATGRTALYDAVLQALQAVSESENGRRILIVLSDGEDNQSNTELAVLKESLESQNALVFCVGLFAPGEPQTNAGALREIAESTGGSAVFEKNISRLSSVLSSILADVRSRYVLTFRPELPESGKSEVRKLSVEARDDSGRRLKVRSRKQYRVTGGALHSNN